MPTRRAFLQRSGLALVGSTLLPSVLTRAAWAAQDGGVTSRYGDDTILVVIQMQGGNDGLNTVVPYGYDGYYTARPNLAIKEADVLPLTDSIGLHPEMGKLADRFKAGQVAIIQGVGYPGQTLSHFSATDVWLTGVPGGSKNTGWLANYLASTSADENNPMFAASVTQGLNRALNGAGATVPAVASLQTYQFRTDPRYAAFRASELAYAQVLYSMGYSNPVLAQIARTGANAVVSSERVQSAANAYSSAVDYPQFPLANSLKTVAQLMAGNMGTRLYYVQFGGFDTHSAEANTHARLLNGFSESVDAFLRDAAAQGKADQVLLMSFSEFGRRVQQNGSIGTDHGTAGPMFVIGSRVKGGLYGDHPSLLDLDGNRNLKWGIDFRAVYGTVLDDWVGADQTLALGSRFENVGFV
jgi:uncharacterized protein (DUF1501 family)